MAFQIDDLKNFLAEIVREEVERVFAEHQAKPQPLLVDTEGTAQLLSAPESWVATAARQGKIPVVRLGHHVRFKISDLEKFIDEQREGVEVPALRRRNNKSDNREGSNGRLAGSNNLLAVRSGQLPQQKS